MSKIKFDKEIKIKIPQQEGYKFVGAYSMSDDKAMENFRNDFAAIGTKHKKPKVYRKEGEKYLFLYESL